MKYGKNGIAKKEREIFGKTGKVHKKINVFILKLFLFFLLCILVSLFCAGIGIFRGIIDSAPDIDSIDATPVGYLSTVLDKDKKPIAKLVASGSNRIYVTLDEIPSNLQHAFIAIEDARFYEHNGIDLKGILRAGAIGLSNKHFSEGASTITQQLLKNNVFTNWTSQTSFIDKIQRKLQEQYLALQLEKTQSKEWILENYLNTINLGQNTLGVQAASQRYFQKDVSDLTLSECAVIAGITQNPARFNPVSNPKENAKRRKKILKNMYEQGFIQKKEYKKALSDDVYSRIQSVNSEIANDSITSYFVDELTEQVANDLIKQKGYTKNQAYKALYNGGLTIYSTQDSQIQQICDEEASNPANYDSAPQYSFSYRLSVKRKDGSTKNYDETTLLNYYRKANPSYTLLYPNQNAASDAIAQYKAAILTDGNKEIPNSEVIQYTLQPQTALTVIDQKTGAVKALVGGRGEKTASKTLNRAANTTRQPGSTFKILAAYAPALDTGGMTLATVQDDAPYTYSNGTPLHNYDNHYHGFTTLREAITNSINVVTVKTSNAIGIDTCFDYLKKFGFTTLSNSDQVQSLCLGGITNGVTNLELTAAYASIANNGSYIKPRFYTKVVDHKGNILLKNKPNQHTVLKKTTAFLLTNAMEDVVKNGTGKLANFDSMPIAGKTGTTTKNRDALFAGYTPYYTCVVWGGYDDNSELSSTAYPKLIWKAIMQRIHSNLPKKDFKKPDGIVTCDVCKKSGKLAVKDLCDQDPRGSMIETEYFADGTQPTEVCDRHISITICTSSGMPAGEFCPTQNLKSDIFMTDGSPDTDDTPYLFAGTSNNETCNIHTEKQKKNTSKKKTQKKKKKKKNSDTANFIQPGPPIESP